MKLPLTIFRTGFIPIVIILLLGGCKNNSPDNFLDKVYPNDPTSIDSSEEIKTLLTDSDLNLYRRDSVKNFYASRNFEPIWNDVSIRQSFIDSLQSAESQGLYFEDYHGTELKKLNEDIKNSSTKQLSGLELLLTDAFFRFGDHLYNGKTDPKKIHGIWDIDKDQINLKILLEQAIKENNLEVAFDKLRPKNPVYSQLIASEKEFRQLKKESENFKEISKGEIIKNGMQDARIQDIQFRLLALGYLDNVKIGNFSYTEDMIESVKKFQEDHGIEVDGNIGDETIQLLNKGYDKRYNQILVNLERWRWYPRDLGNHYILINIPGYNLQVIKDGDTTSTHKIMVGTIARKTPIFSNEIDHVIFNPEWNIPPTIKLKDVIPGVRRDPDYLAKKNIEVYDGNGNRLDPSNIDWSQNEVKSYKYRQAPGSSNPLGRVKIMYPNKYLVYLHDTPSKSLFERNTRAQSSGCIRVEGAIELAEYLLNDQPEMTSEKIQPILDRGTIKKINMTQQVKIYHFYWTAWRENGKTRFIKDIYNYDDKILKALENPS